MNRHNQTRKSFGAQVGSFRSLLHKGMDIGRPARLNLMFLNQYGSA
jgi:hypothetical protein